MRLAVSALGSVLATACAVPNPLYGAETGSLGDGSGAGTGDATGSVDAAGTTTMSTIGTGTAGGEGTNSATGASTAVSDTAKMEDTSDTAEDDTGAPSSSTGADTVGPVQPPCNDTPGGFEVLGCWDFDALNAAGDEVFNRVEDGPSIFFSGPITPAPGLWGQALGAEDSPFGVAEMDAAGNVLIEVWFQTDAPNQWPEEGTILRLWRDVTQSSEFAGLRLFGPPDPRRQFDGGLMSAPLVTLSAVTDCAAFAVEEGEMDIHTGLSSGTFFATVGDVGSGGFSFTVGNGAAAIIDGIRISSTWTEVGICSPPPP